MTTAATSNEKLAEEYTAYRKIYRAVLYFHYLMLAALFIYLCTVIVDNHGFLPPNIFVFLKEILPVAGIWYVFHICETKGGLLKPLWHWERSLLIRIRHEEALDVLRNGGIYFIDDCEMTLVDGFLVPKHRVK